MPIHIHVWPDHLVLATMDEHERVITFRYGSWRDVLADFGYGIVRADRILVKGRA